MEKRKLNYGILKDDLDLIREIAQDCRQYDFAADVRALMKAEGLSASSLGKLCGVSHTIVGKWINGSARPHGKERMKELGLALGMNETALNEFLYANCYPRLHTKSPLDDACLLLLRACGSGAEVVQKYHDLVEHYRLRALAPGSRRSEIKSAILSGKFRQVSSPEQFAAWLSENEKHFEAFYKTQLANNRLARFLLLYIGDATINQMYSAAELPLPIRNLLYPLVSDREVAMKGLRSKLIVFGLYRNMTEDEIDIMLDYARLRPLSIPNTVLESALLTALRCAHGRYPYYEFESLSNVIGPLRSLAAIDDDFKLQLATYEELLDNAADSVGYYDENARKTQLDILFEQTYTSYSDSGIIQYIYDIFTVLSEEGLTDKRETAELLALMSGGEI